MMRTEGEQVRTPFAVRIPHGTGSAVLVVDAVSVEEATERARTELQNAEDAISEMFASEE
jgi:hypothetical protein